MKPAFPTQEDLVTAYIRYEKGEDADSDWTTSYFFDLAYEYPEECFDTILKILEIDQSRRVLALTAAGPLEDLISQHGKKILSKITDEAKCNKVFSAILAGVWQHGTPEEVWKEIQKLANHEEYDRLCGGVEDDTVHWGGKSE